MNTTVSINVADSQYDLNLIKYTTGGGFEDNGHRTMADYIESAYHTSQIFQLANRMQSTDNIIMPHLPSQNSLNPALMYTRSMVCINRFN